MRDKAVMPDKNIPDIQIDCVGTTVCPRCAATVDVSSLRAFESTRCSSCKTRFAAPGKIGAYVLLRQLSLGEMGASYRGFDTSMSRHVQVNVMRRALRQDQEKVSAFLAEARALGVLDHRNAARAFFVGDEDGRPYSVTELVVGDSLKTVLAPGRPLQETGVLEAAVGLAGVLAAAAGQDIVHGDVRPANVIFTSRPQGTVKLVNFRFAAGKGPRATTEAPPIEPCYAPPEHIEGKVIDARSDVFGLGATLFHALAGNKPFDDDGPQAAAAARRKAAAPDILTHRPMLRQETADVLAAMLHADPDKRPQDPRALLDDLHRALEASRKPKPIAGKSGRPGRNNGKPNGAAIQSRGTDYAAAALAAMGDSRKANPRPKPQPKAPAPPPEMVELDPAPPPPLETDGVSLPTSRAADNDSAVATLSQPRSRHDRVVVIGIISAAAIGILVALAAIFFGPNIAGPSNGADGDADSSVVVPPTGSGGPASFGGKVGLGTWKTAAVFKDVHVTLKERVALKGSFSQAAIRKQWKRVRGNWQHNRNTYGQVDAGMPDAFALVGDTSWTDYTLTLKARKTKGTGGFFIPFRWRDDKNYFVWNIGGKGNKHHKIERKVNGAAHVDVCKQVNGKVKTNQWYEIRIQLDGPRIRCSLDGRMIHDVVIK